MGLLRKHSNSDSDNDNNENTKRNHHFAIQQDETKEEWYDHGGGEEEDINTYGYGYDNGEDHIPTEFMVPIGESIEKHRKSLTSLRLDNDSLHETQMNNVSEDNDNIAFSNNNSPFRRSSSSQQLQRKMSTVSLFSLATHSSKSSTATLDQLDHDFFADDEQQEECSWRLYHIASNTLITEKNHRSFIAHGMMYDTVARFCMEHAQEMMKQAGNLEWVQIPMSCSSSTSGSGGGGGGDKDKNDSVGALVSRGYLEKSNNNGSNRPTLLILTGTGQVQAGIFSRRHLMTSSIEAASALPFIRQAVARDMNIVVLDPNRKGPQKAMEVVERSLDELWCGVSQKKGSDRMNTDMFVLAHSMGGSQIVRYLLKKTTETNTGMNDSMNEAKTMSAAVVLHEIKSLAFTDSNHNINWTKNNPALTNLLVDARSVYIKSHKTHEKAKSRGEAVDDCHFWRHRFGTIKTLWAGTHEHALTNYTARWQIWNHFDSFLIPEQEDGNEEDGALTF